MKFITRTIPIRWSRGWLALWAVIVVVLIAGAIALPWWAFLPLFLIGFGIPEAIGIAKGADAYPPLTHVIRHFVEGWLAFPLLYGLLGTFGGKAVAFKRWWAIGVLFAVLGWITHHFVFTYIAKDPWPGGVDPETGQ